MGVAGQETRIDRNATPSIALGTSLQTQIAPLEISELVKEVAEAIVDLRESRARMLQIQVRGHRLLDTRAAPESDCAMLLFLVAFALGDRAESDKWISYCESHSFFDPATIQNQVVVLTGFGNLEKALNLIDRMVELYPDNKQILYRAIMESQCVLSLDRAIRYVKKYQLLSTNDLIPMNPKVIDTIENSAQQARKYGFADEDLIARLAVSIEAIRGSGFEVVRQARNILRDGSFVSQLFIDADARSCADLTFTVADALVESFQDPGIEVLSIICRPLSDYKHVAQVSLI